MNELIPSTHLTSGPELDPVFGPVFSKGHGTGNDFVVVLDPDGELELTEQWIAAVCHRRTGIGGDGLLRIVRSAALRDADAVDSGHLGATWFMDYRNADGSPAQMCGNGTRVFLDHLVASSLVDLPVGGVLSFGTRSGIKTGRRTGEHRYAVDLGPWTMPGGQAAVAAGHDAMVTVAGDDVPRPALTVDLGNPHTVVALASEAELAALDLTRPPVVEPVPVAGTNVEFVVPAEAGRLVMRVHERGVGETLSCGTGAVAAVLAFRAWGGPQAPGHWLVDVPGGRLTVQVDGQVVELEGPAEIVAELTVTDAWRAQHR